MNKSSDNSTMIGTDQSGIFPQRKGFRETYGGFSRVKCGWSQYSQKFASKDAEITKSTVEIKKDNIPESENATEEEKKEIEGQA